jgi:hypothetical protein
VGATLAYSFEATRLVCLDGALARPCTISVSSLSLHFLRRPPEGDTPLKLVCGGTRACSSSRPPYNNAHIFSLTIFHNTNVLSHASPKRQGIAIAHTAYTITTTLHHGTASREHPPTSIYLKTCLHPSFMSLDRSMIKTCLHPIKTCLHPSF